MDNDEHKQIYYLDELSNYKVSNDDKDVRGWKVRDLNGKAVGTVENLIVNKESERTIYLDITVDSSIIESGHDPYGGRDVDRAGSTINKEKENNLIIPIGLVNLNLDNEIVSVEGIAYDTFSKTKRKSSKAPISRDYEFLILETYHREKDYSGYPKDDSLYKREEFTS